MSKLIANLVDVGHQFEEGPEIFKRVTFSIEPGSFQFLTGPSGSGKSSLLRILQLDLKPRWGSLHLFGEDTLLVKTPAIPPLRQRVGVVFQEFKLLYHLNVIDNVALPLLIRGLGEKNSHKQAKELLDWVGLGDSLYAHPATLSGGEKQRVAIARAVITKPDLLLADEPTGNVDDDMAMKLLLLFEELNKEGTAILIATHNPRLLERTDYPQFNLQEGTLKKVTKR